ncbi:hypothetical protein QVD17_18337 [Tagetes erecta]|uniref:Uncharacterized protein n=1 Tax=Tagetes erecta TaxID=13708 RepID=A0AAD8KHR0_TARER|nr:hypothetical protein QVD17_18337 [Tagetes erecta]
MYNLHLSAVAERERDASCFCCHQTPSIALLFLSPPPIVSSVPIDSAFTVCYPFIGTPWLRCSSFGDYSFHRCMQLCLVCWSSRSSLMYNNGARSGCQNEALWRVSIIIMKATSLLSLQEQPCLNLLTFNEFDFLIG